MPIRVGTRERPQYIKCKIKKVLVHWKTFSFTVLPTSLHQKVLKFLQWCSLTWSTAIYLFIYLFIFLSMLMDCLRWTRKVNFGLGLSGKTCPSPNIHKVILKRYEVNYIMYGTQMPFSQIVHSMSI